MNNSRTFMDIRVKEIKKIFMTNSWTFMDIRVKEIK